MSGVQGIVGREARTARSEIHSLQPSRCRVWLVLTTTTERGITTIRHHWTHERSEATVLSVGDGSRSGDARWWANRTRSCFVEPARGQS